MKILEITFNPPNTTSGGGLGVYQSIYSLAQNAEVDYIGPDYDEKLFKNCKYHVNRKCILEPSINKRQIVLNFFLHKASTSYYNSWQKFQKNISWDKYDVVHIEFSRYSFVINEAHRHQKKVITRVHNIESDYGYHIYRLSHNVGDFLRFISFRVNEKKAMQDSDKLIFITSTDLKRGMKLYSVSKDKVLMNPVCINTKPFDYQGEDKNIRILITGSLNYMANLEGIYWFLDNVWDEIIAEQKDYKITLTIAGGHPGNEFKKRISKIPNIQLVDTPLDMEPYFRETDIYVAPIFDGAGMKVKVAEALSYGLPVIGTKHAFIGYEQIEKGKYEVDGRKQMISTLVELENSCKKQTLHREIWQEFNSKLSMESSAKRYQRFLSSTFDKEK